MSKRQPRPSELLELPSTMTPAEKAAAVRKAKRGIRPANLSAQKWAWHPLNPNGRRS